MPEQAKANPPPAPSPGPAPPTTFRMDAAVDKYRQLRDRKKEIQERHASELKPYNEALEQIEVVLLHQLNTLGVDSMKTENGTAYKSTRTSISIDDPAVFRKWVEENNRPDFFENRVSKEAIQNWVNEGHSLPPGLKVSADTVVNVRK